MIWPLVYCLFLTTSLGWVFQRGFPEESPWQIARLAPIMGLSMDYFENIATITNKFDVPILGAKIRFINATRSSTR